MIKYALSAAVAMLALGAPGAVHAQAAQPMPSVYPSGPVMTRTSTTTTVTTTTRVPHAGGAGDRDFGLSGDAAIEEPDLAPLSVALAPPGAVWVPGHYDWDAARQNYVWHGAQLTLPPHPNAQWIAGHWRETPTAWVWVDDRWN